jgi:hypothetical protein
MRGKTLAKKEDKSKVAESLRRNELLLAASTSGSEASWVTYEMFTEWLKSLTK